jgi:hypothetical protein
LVRVGMVREEVKPQTPEGLVVMGREMGVATRLE